MMSEAVPVREDLFDEVDGGRLHANKCKACGRTYFPKAPFCFDCLAKEMENVILSRQGKLYSYAVGRMPSTHLQPPYAVGLVDLPEGVRVFAPLMLTADESYKIGMKMEVYIDGLWEEEGKQITGYKFKPVG
jgi:uncharacterized OB-fold protein